MPWSFEPTYKELKLSYPSLLSRFHRRVLSLPIRNWNEPDSGILVAVKLCFEPTYKELKPSFLTSSKKYIDSFEPTYKELKPVYIY